MVTLSKCCECGRVFSCNGYCHSTSQNCMCCSCWGIDLDQKTRLRVFRKDECERLKYIRYNPSLRFNPSSD